MQQWPKLEETYRSSVRIIKARPSYWFWFGLAGLSAWAVPQLLVFAFFNASGRSFQEFLRADIEIDIRGINTAFWWSCLTGLFTSALAVIRRQDYSVTPFIRGFFGGFFLLPFAVALEFLRPGYVTSMVISSALLFPLWPLGTIWLLFMAERKPLLKSVPSLFSLAFQPGYHRWLAVEAVGGCLLLLGLAAPPLLILAIPIRVLLLSLTYHQVSPGILEQGPSQA